MATRSDDLYHDDFYAWTRDQAAALRKLQAERWNGPLDLTHLAEEVEERGSEQKWAVLSQLERLIEHLLKLESSSERPRRQWMISIIEGRGDANRRMTGTIRREVEPELAKSYRRARRKTALALQDHGEDEAASSLPAECPYALDDLLDEDWWPVSRHGLPND